MSGKLVYTKEDVIKILLTEHQYWMELVGAKWDKTQAEKSIVGLKAVCRIIKRFGVNMDDREYLYPTGSLNKEGVIFRS